MDNKKWIVSAVNEKNIHFDKIFERRNKYSMTKNEFFKPDISHLHDGSLMLGMKKSVNRINSAISNKEKIYIYGDYDVDGTSATAILLKTFHLLAYANVCFYIPNRKTEGYGLNNDAVEKISKDNCNLIITVDCGITAVDEVLLANKLGMDVIITDHHQVGDKVPKAYSIINPHQPNCKYPYKNLCGAAVAYKLARELLKSNNIQESGELIEIAGIATIADIMEINGENRIIVKQALKEIKKSSNIGIDALIHEAGLNKNEILSYGIGFGISPRINSAGRIDDASLAVKLYMSKNETEAKTYAKKLNFLNKKRQDMVKEIYELSLIQAVSEEKNQPYVTVSYGENWNKGVIGIVASRLVDEFDKSAVVIAIDGENASASCRAAEGFNFFEAMQSMENLFERYGGHDLAGGFSIKKEKIPSFIRKINSYAKKVLKNKNYEKKIKVDSIIAIDEVSLQNYDKIEMFEPFGIENDKPLFLISDIFLNNVQFIGKEKSHFKAMFKDKNILKFDAFKELENLDTKRKVDIIFHMNKNTYMDNVNIQLFLNDIRYSYDYSSDYKDIYTAIKDNISYFDMNYNFLYEDVKNFDIISLPKLYELEGKTAFLCYSYKSYFYIRKIISYNDKNLSLYQDNLKNENDNSLIFMPLIDKTDFDLFDNIILCDDIKKIEKKIYDYDIKKYMLDFSDFCTDCEVYDLRQNMVLIYNFFRKYECKQIKIEDILNILKIDSMIFFISNCLLEKLKLIDIIYDFQYNKVCAKLSKTNKKQNINENKIFKKFEEYFSVIKQPDF